MLKNHTAQMEISNLQMLYNEIKEIIYGFFENKKSLQLNSHQLNHSFFYKNVHYVTF